MKQQYSLDILREVYSRLDEVQKILKKEIDSKSSRRQLESMFSSLNIDSDFEIDRRT